MRNLMAVAMSPRASLLGAGGARKATSVVIALTLLACASKEALVKVGDDKPARPQLSDAEVKHVPILDKFVSDRAGARVVIYDRGTNYEAVVYDRDTETHFGGAVQYLIDKTTGEVKMGWHGAPQPKGANHDPDAPL